MAAGVSAFLLTVPVWGHSTCCLVKRCHFHFWNKIFLTLEDKSLERFWTIVLLISTTIAGVLCAQCEGHAAPPPPFALVELPYRQSRDKWDWSGTMNMNVVWHETSVCSLCSVDCSLERSVLKLHGIYKTGKSLGLWGVVYLCWCF